MDCECGHKSVVHSLMVNCCVAAGCPCEQFVLARVQVQEINIYKMDPQLAETVRC